RDIDIVLIDVTEPRWHYLPLPSGYGRDALWQLDRAAIIALTKENLADHSQREFAKSLVSAHKNVVAMEYQVGQLQRICDGSSVSVSEVRSQNALLVSGIGRPKAFYKLMSTQLETNIVGHIEFKDHHPYTQQDIQRILHTMENLNAK